ncbi:hypothetical protein MMC19_007541 [Ptychographa xylographoides]|nr:hypothetical protein [Ptychographa xylographoides]
MTTLSSRTVLELPTVSALSSTLRLPATHSSVLQIFSRLSRPCLLALVLEWLADNAQPACAPQLSDNSLRRDSSYDTGGSLEALQEVYSELDKRKGGKREVLVRILEGDWRHGISLRQLAMADIQYLSTHPRSQRWTALKLVPVVPSSEHGQGEITRVPEEAMHIFPRLHAPTFLKNLQREIGSLIKAHYYLARMPSLPITLLRICLFDSPYNHRPSTSTSSFAQSLQVSTTLYIAFPDDTPFIYVSFAAASGQSKGRDYDSLRKLVVDAVPKALSQHRRRYALKSTSLSARSLDVLVDARGPGRGNAAAAGWSIFAQGTVEKSPLSSATTYLEPMQYDFEDKENRPELASRDINHKRQFSKIVQAHGSDSEDRSLDKRAKLVANARFGNNISSSGNIGLERLEIRLEDPIFQSDHGQDPVARIDQEVSHVATPVHKGRDSAVSKLEGSNGDQGGNNEGDVPLRIWTPSIQMTFSGDDVFAGIRSLVEFGAIDGGEMPGWITGENAVNIGVVSNGKIRGNKGSDT